MLPLQFFFRRILGGVTKGKAVFCGPFLLFRDHPTPEIDFPSFQPSPPIGKRNPPFARASSVGVGHGFFGYAPTLFGGGDASLYGDPSSGRPVRSPSASLLFPGHPLNREPHLPPVIEPQMGLRMVSALCDCPFLFQLHPNFSKGSFTTPPGSLCKYALQLLFFSGRRVAIFPIWFRSVEGSFPLRVHAFPFRFVCPFLLLR